jgi:hypothetical protein
MGWMKEKYGKEYAANSRETIRRQTVHQFEQARLIDRNPDDPTRPTNSGETKYQLTKEAADVLRSFGTRAFSKKCEHFLKGHGSLTEAYERARHLLKVPVTLPNGSKVELSPGLHNELQRLIVEEFAPRFARGSVVVYLGDAGWARETRADAVEVFELRASGQNYLSGGRKPPEFRSSQGAYAPRSGFCPLALIFLAVLSRFPAVVPTLLADPHMFSVCPRLRAVVR